MKDFMDNSRKLIVFCPDEQIIYSRTYKVASSTVMNRLLTPPVLSYGEAENGRRHELPDEYRHLYESWDGWFSFTFVRNPWDRLVSIYSYFTERGVINCSFKELIMGDGLDSQVVRDHCAPCHLHTHHNGEQMVSFIGRFENFDEDASWIKPGTFPKMNPSQHGHYRNYYDKETAKRVSEIYAEDIEIFGYEF